MEIRENVSLAEYTTFKIGGPARFFCVCADEQGVLEAVRFAREKGISIFVLGGGSNVLVSDDGYHGLVIKMDIGGIKLASESGGDVIISAGAGVMWDDFVAHTVEHGLYGLENLSAIPGTVGACPVQNIGAYGTEASRVVRSVRAYDLQRSAFVELSAADCGFGYRDSMFKHAKGRYIVTGVAFALKKDAPVDISYKDIKDYFAAHAITSPTHEQVRHAVIDVRWNKLPDWKLWGTAGSFFKNPIISAAQFKKLSEMYPGLPSYPEPDGRIKTSAGYILDKICGARGSFAGDVGTYEKQALVVVVRKPGVHASDVVEFTRDLMRQAKEKTDIDLEAEVEWVN